MLARVEFVNRHFSGALVDVGIGAGSFIELRNAERNRRPNTFGYDVNPMARDWLLERSLWIDPYTGRVPAISLWDVLEHIADFDALLARVAGWVFVSIPIFFSGEHVLSSKHFRKDEHIWYFTSEGLVRTFADRGFDLVETNRIESDLGREDIGSFAFRRRA